VEEPESPTSAYRIGLTAPQKEGSVSNQNLPPGVKQRVVVASVVIRVYDDLQPEVQLQGHPVAMLGGLTCAIEAVHETIREQRAKTKGTGIVIPDLGRKN
jgi:hypothetical protein